MRANEAGRRMSGKRRIHIDYSGNIMIKYIREKIVDLHIILLVFT
ncbi:hypothetical protein [Acetohalobium arabaticum]|nr:hypothetical protein [Acetohalobium arabaticum]